MHKLSGKVAVVTGASKGIGAQVARELAAQGAAVVVNYASSREDAAKVVDSIESAGGKAVAVAGNVARAADVEGIFAQARQAYGKLDILVNNAGVYSFAPIDSISEEHIDTMFDVNIKGLLLATRAALPLIGSEGGSIINIGSVVGEQTPPQSAVYSATKAALNAITKVLAKELGPRGVRVNAVNPGPVVTEGFRSGGFAGGPYEEQIISRTPLGRLGSPRDIATVVAFLAGGDAQWITGALIDTAGGMY